MLSNIRVRMKLSDFINTDNEKEIMEMINKTHSDLSTTILLHLWYENDEISSTDLKDFLLRWENILHFRTIVKNNSNVEQYEFVFFDIIPISVPKNEKYRFAYTYINTDKIRLLLGLNCIPITKTSKYENVYSYTLKNKINHIEFTSYKELINIYNELENNNELCLDIIKNNKEYLEKSLNYDNLLMYIAILINNLFA